MISTAVLPMAVSARGCAKMMIVVAIAPPSILPAVAVRRIWYLHEIRFFQVTKIEMRTSGLDSVFSILSLKRYK